MSRKHLLFGFAPAGLTVTDRSTNGTTLFLQHGTQGDFLHLATRLFTKGDRAQIVPGVEIIRSGREYPSELPRRRPPRRPDGPPPSATVVF